MHLVTRGEVPQGVTVWEESNDRTNGLAASTKALPTNPRWRCPALKPWLQMPLCRLAPPPRSFADDAYDCIMVAICKRIDRIQGCGVTSAPRWQAPLGSVVPRSSGCKTTHVGERKRPHNRNPQWPRTAPNDLCTSRRQIMMARTAHSPSSPAPSARRKRLWGLTARRSRAWKKRGAHSASVQNERAQALYRLDSYRFS